MTRMLIYGVALIRDPLLADCSRTAANLRI